jgi:endonuclease YncB( thermonuclease family)
MKFLKLINALPLVAVLGLAGYWYWSQLPKTSATRSPLPPKTVSPRTDYDPPTDLWQVISVHDGDTIKVRRGSQEKKVRFACVDAPEISQPMGKESRDYLRKLLSSGRNEVMLKVVDTDRYNRAVAEVWLDRIGSPELVQSIEAGEGMAYAYDRYKENCLSWEAVKSAENTAISSRAGVWNQPGLEKPWDYRKRTR